MENFNIKRFGRTFRWYFCENRSKLISYNIGLALGLFLMESFILWFTYGRMEGVQLEPWMLVGLIPLCTFVISAFCLYAFSNIFSALKTKQRRIAYLTLPATNLERYLSALILAVVVWPVCVYLAVVVGDTLRTVVFGLIGKGWASGVSAFSSIRGHYEGSWVQILEILTLFISGVWACSIHVLGGSLLRKRPFLITVFTMSVLFSIFVYIVAQCRLDLTLFWGDEGVRYYSEKVYWVDAVLAVLTVVNFFCSYQLFKRFQLITSKWFNV